MFAVIPFISKILFAGSILAIIVTAIVVVIGMRRYSKEVKNHRSLMARLELEESKRKRQEKEAEVIRRYWENQQRLEGQLQAASDNHN